MEKETFLQKVNRRGWYEIRKRLKGRAYLWTFRSYWHYLINRKNNSKINKTCYYAARPNIGAGIGHQIANWNAGYWFAKQFGLMFAHIPFPSDKWETFLGFGRNEVQYYELLKKGYKIRRLPQFSEYNEAEYIFNKNIINSYAETKTILLATQDQFYKDQFGVLSDIQRKFYSAPERKNDKLVYKHDCFNIAIHVRRGDIMADLSNPNLSIRYLSNNYFKKVLLDVINNLHLNKPVHIYFFSQGQASDYSEFDIFENFHWCFNMSAQASFLHMVYADLLITSKSSFSYKPALLNKKGIKICPRDFWHGYPQKNDWILADNDGKIEEKELKKLKKILINFEKLV